MGAALSDLSAKGKTPSKSLDDEYEERKQALARGVIGAVGIRQLSRVIIYPEIDTMNATDLARLTVESICLYCLENENPKFGDRMDCTDQELFEIGEKCRKDLLGRYFGISRE
jgi:hypothetical protein